MRTSVVVSLRAYGLEACEVILGGSGEGEKCLSGGVILARLAAEEVAIVMGGVARGSTWR